MSTVLTHLNGHQIRLGWYSKLYKTHTPYIGSLWADERIELTFTRRPH